jgi:uncharacterized Zn-binding protein involved in type VI secretion
MSNYIDRCSKMTDGGVCCLAIRLGEEKDMPYTIEGKEVILLGDTTTHGGKVITASETHSYMGIPVARVGDMVECPKCKGTYPIVEGAPKAFDRGKPIARHGDKVACGATLISRNNKIVITVMPQAPPPLAAHEMKDFHKQAEKQGLGDRKTLAQYRLVTSGTSMNSGHSNGWETYNAPINGEALIYVKNINPTPIGSITHVIVKAGIYPHDVHVQQQILGASVEHIFRFTNRVYEWYIAVNAPTDIYMLKFEIWTKDFYAD